jgi:flagellar biosynthesis GTPase FlhF
MFGLKYAKFAPGYHVFRYKNGKLAKQGDGLSFFYFSPFTSLVVVKTGTADAHFMFSEVTVDFQEVTIQGQLTYRISDPLKTVNMLNHTVNNRTLTYITGDPQKLPERLINLALVATKSVMKSLPLKEALASGDLFASGIFSSLKEDAMVAELGIDVLSVTVAAVKPNAETARALEAQTREQILRESDDALFQRRNAAVEQERAIRENELNTEIAVEDKNREIREKQMLSQLLVQQKEQQMREEALEHNILQEERSLKHNISQEERNKDLVELQTQNQRKQSDARAYEVSAILKAYTDANPEIIKLLANANMDTGKLMSLAFQDIASNADKIGQLNISPDLLREILDR